MPYSRFRSSLFAVLCIFTPLLCSAGQAAQNSPADQAFLSFQAPDSTGTYPQSINDLMVVTGYYTTSWGATRGFVRYADGSITTFAVPGAQATKPVSINHAGDITGFYEVPPQFTDHSFVSAVPQGFVRTADGTITTFGNAPSGLADTHFVWFSPVAINDAGEIVGNQSDGPIPGVFTRSASGVIEEFTLSSTNGYTEATGMNASGAIVGFSSQSGTSAQGFLWSGNGTPPSATANTTTSIIVDGSTWTTPTAINAEGDVIGCYGNLLTFMRDQEDVITTIYIPGAISSCGAAINDAGTIVGFFVSATQVHSGFVKPLHGEVTPFVYPGATSTTPTSVNNLDVITGYYSRGSATEGFLLVGMDPE